GSARKTTSASLASVSAESGVITPSQRWVRPGNRLDEAPVCPEDIAAPSATSGWRDSRRSSSCPVYPVAPATATRGRTAAGSAVLGEEAPGDETLSDCAAVCIEGNSYT